MGFKELLTMVSLIAGAVVAVGASVTWGMNTWTDYGWVTKGQFAEESMTHVTIGQLDGYFDAHIRDDAHLLASEEAEDEISEQRRVLNRVLVSTLKDEVLEWKKTACEAPNNQQIQEALDAAIREYEEAAGSAFPDALLVCR